jgi:hypothetical protein
MLRSGVKLRVHCSKGRRVPVVTRRGKNEAGGFIDARGPTGQRTGGRGCRSRADKKPIPLPSISERGHT